MEPSSPKGLKSAKSLPAESLNIEILKNGGCPSVAKINKQNPSISNTQFSEAFVRVRSGSQNQIDNIQVGWMAGKKGCYNMLCTGSVQVNKAIPLGFILHNISVYGGQKFDFGYFISQIQGIGDFNMNIGYWPKSLFSSLSNAATQLTWGGGVFSSNPPMGSGHFAEEGMKKQLISERFLLKNLVMEDLLTQGVSKTSQMIPSVTALVLFQESIMAFFMGVQESAQGFEQAPCQAHKTEGGDSFDCVDIHRQPAFEHPLLKNHQIHMKQVPP
ncbi:Neprosin - like 6 [Theobroma cacao]|nr:Neprosin - like 6 [Theobroma cacao]